MRRARLDQLSERDQWDLADEDLEPEPDDDDFEDGDDSDDEEDGIEAFA